MIQRPQNQNLLHGVAHEFVDDTVVAHVDAVAAAADVAALRNIRKDQVVLATVEVGASAVAVAHTVSLGAECRTCIHCWEGEEADHWTHLDTTALSVFVYGTVHY